MLEDRMKRGMSSIYNQHWAEEELGIDAPTFKKFEALILHVWTEGRVTLESLNARRDLHRTRLTELYLKTLDKDDFKTALKALDSLARFDGLDQPGQLNITLNKGQITNEARSNVMTLLEKMKAMAVSSVDKRKQLAITDQSFDDDDDEDEDDGSPLQ